MHLADAFIQSDLQCIQAIHLFLSVHLTKYNFCIIPSILKLYKSAVGVVIFVLLQTNTIINNN